jgi:hypothetical protein
MHINGFARVSTLQKNEILLLRLLQDVTTLLFRLLNSYQLFTRPLLCFGSIGAMEYEVDGIPAAAIGNVYAITDLVCLTRHPSPVTRHLLRYPLRRRTMLAYCLLMATCAGITGADWEARIGQFSFDDAQRVLGTPESCAALDNGGTACSWTTSSGENWMDKLVLTFDANGELATANKVHF